MTLKGLCGFVSAWLVAVVMAHGQTWTAQGIGNVGVAGSATALSADAFSVSGSGADIGNTADSFEFLYQELAADGMVIARVASVPTVDPSSKAGLIIRESLNANARNAAIVVTRDRGIQFLTRKTTGGLTTTGLTLAGQKAPQWLKLIRSGTNYSAYISTDNVTWGLFFSDSVSMTGTVYVGMAVTSYKNTVLGTAEFDHMLLVPGTVTDVSDPVPPVLASGARSNASVALSWSGASDDVGISSYIVERDGVTVATLPGTSSSYIDNGLTPSTTYVYTVKASDASSKVSQASNSVSATTDVTEVGDIDNWQDIGTVGLAGSTSFDPVSSTYTVQAAGADIDGVSDSFRFGYQQCDGDLAIVVRVASIQNTTNSWTKAGAMIRNGLVANDPEASILVTYANGVVFQSRKLKGGTTVTTATYAYPSMLGKRPPQWVKLVRHGNDFKGYVSGDGVNWEYVGGDTVAMASTAYGGLAVSSRNTNSLCSVVFANLNIAPPVDVENPSNPFGLNIYSLSDVSLSLSWKPSNDDIAVDGYKIFQDGVWIGMTPFTWFTNTFQDPGSSHSYTVQAVDAAGNLSAVSSAISGTLNAATLPAPWHHDDIGGVDWAGSASLNDGVFGISGAGSDIAGSQDSFHYIYQPLNGDKTIVARVASIPNPPNTSVKAGIMIRETLDAGSRNAMFLVLGGSGANLQWRATTDGVSSSLSGDRTAKAPYWVKLVRGGSRFAGYQSVDGTNWTLAGLSTVPMDAAGYIGLALTSRDPRTLASATFDSVQITSDSDNNGLPDSWELTWFSKIGIDPNALAARNDGLTNLEAFQQGLNPLDYYNGVAPKLTKVSGDSQNGAINTFLNQPLILRVTDTNGAVLANAPVTVKVLQGGGLVATATSGTPAAASLVLHSDTDGLVNVHYQEGGNWGVASSIQFTAGKTSTTFSATALPQVGYWTFNSHTGNTVPDSSKTGNTANTIGGVTWGTGFDGTGAIALDGGTGHVEVSSSPSFALGSGAMSITAWVRLPQNLSLDDESKIYPVVTLGDESVDGVSLCVRGGGHGLQVRINTAAGIVELDGGIDLNVLTDGYWHQVGLICDASGNVSVVFDGAIVASQAGVPVTPVASPRLWLGCDSAGRYFGGSIDEVEVRRDALAAADVLTRYNVDSNRNGMADWWKWRYFGTLAVAATADPDGDGVTNLQEFKNGTSPTDYFDGIAPVITKVSGDNQNGAPSCYLAQGLSIRVNRADGSLLANAPVSFTVQSGGGFVATGTTALTTLTTLALRTGTDGRAVAYYKTGSSFGVASQIQVVGGKSSCVFSADASPLVAQWKFEDASGAAALDSSRTGNTLTLNGGAVWGQGYDGRGAVALDGIDGYLATGSSATLALSASSAVTAATWVRLPSNLSLDSAKDVYPIITFGTATADSLALIIRGGGNGANIVLNKDATTLASVAIPSSAIVNGDWHHVGFVVDGLGNVTVFFDGRILTKVAGQSSTINAPRVWLGRDVAGNYFKGGMDDAIVRREALALTDFQGLYNAGAEGDGLPNWWKWQRFGTLDVDPDATAEGSAMTHLQKYQAEIEPDVSVSDIPGLPAGRGIAGQVLWERWCGPELLDTGIEDIRRFGKYPLHPDETRNLPNFEIKPANGKISSASRLRAYVVPPVSGPYRFYVTGQDSASLYVSLSGKSYERQLACSANMIAPNTWTKSSGIYYLQAGARYYLELVVQAETRPGYAQVGWTTPTDGAPKLIPGERLISMGAEDDSNDVGMSDEWQMTQFGGLTQWSNQDPDGDGLTNLQEFQRGTDPMNSDTGNTGVVDAGKQAGRLTFDYWLNVSGTSASAFVASADYARAPDGRTIIESVSEPSILSQKYASVLRGYFVPSVTGTYGFQAKVGTDGVAAYLSTDSSPENRTLLFDKLSTPATRTLTAGQRYYFEFVHKVEAGNQAAILLWQPPGATAYAAADVRRFVPLNAGGVSPQEPLPSPWQRGEIFVNRGWTAYPGLSSIDAGGTLEILGAGRRTYSHSDGLHWVYQELPDGAQIQARLLSHSYIPTEGASAGLMIRQSLVSGSPEAMLHLTEYGSLSFTARLLQDGFANNGVSIPCSGPVWMRLLRKGGTVYAYTSQDGVQWALFDQQNVNLTGSAYVGIFATSGLETQFCRALFDNLDAGVDPVIAASLGTTDTDGDGYTDYEETQFLHSNPLVNDLQPPTTVVNLAGSAGTGTIGTWSTDGSAIYNISTRGAVDYKVEVPQNGIYRIAIQGTPRINTLTNNTWNVLVSVDGQYLQTVRYELAMGQVGTAYVYTPWLTAGSHTIRLYLNNVSIYRSFAFTSVKLQAIEGADANSNGIPDWMENRMAAQNSIGTGSFAAQSRTSPFCLEGTVRYLQSTSLTTDDVSIPVKQGVGEGWYADVPLDPDAPLAVTAQFENGGKTAQKEIEWVATNLLNSGVPDNTLKIRKGDALLLTAAPENATSGTVAITVTLGDQTVATLETGVGDAEPYQFVQAGTYTVSATWQDGVNPDVTGTLTVEVAEASFAKPHPFVTLGYPREWLNPLLPAGTVVESDSRMEVVELAPPPTGGRNFRLRIDTTAEKRVMLARLNDGTQQGPILDQAIITGVGVYSGAQTGIYLLDQYSDGSSLVEMHLVLSDFPEGFRAKISIFAAGVTFEDGTLERWITAADFDAQGQLKMRFIMAAGSYTSVCHRLYIYQGDTLLETRIN